MSAYLTTKLGRPLNELRGILAHECEKSTSQGECNVVGSSELDEHFIIK
jgi:hypothetical protein